MSASNRSRRKSESDDDQDSPEVTADKLSGVKLTKRAHLIKELVSTQLQFTTDMSQLYEAMKAEAAKLTDPEGRALFVRLADVITISTDLYRVWNQELLKYASNQCDNAKIALVTKPLAEPLSETLFKYAKKYDVAVFENNESTEEVVAVVLKRMRQHKPLLVNLNTELIKPVQRMFKYAQLFEQLKDQTAENHRDYRATCEVFDIFRQLLRKANEDKRWNEILNEVFKDPSKSRRMRKISKKAFPSENMPTDPNLALYKWKLDELRSTTIDASDWVRKHIDLFDDIFKLESKFLESTMRFCQPDGNCCLHSKIGWNPSCCPVCCKTLSAQTAITNTVLATLAFIIVPKMRKNVINRFDELLSMLDDPELVIDQLQRKEKELMYSENQLRQMKMKNQPTGGLEEKCSELSHTKQTLLNNLLKELPILLRRGEKLLLTISAYACLLISDFAKNYADQMKQRLDVSKDKPVCPQMSTEEFAQFIEGLQRKLLPGAQKLCQLVQPNNYKSGSRSPLLHQSSSSSKSSGSTVRSNTVRPPNNSLATLRVPEIVEPPHTGVLRAVSERRRRLSPAEPYCDSARLQIRRDAHKLNDRSSAH